MGQTLDSANGYYTSEWVLIVSIFEVSSECYNCSFIDSTDKNFRIIVIQSCGFSFDDLNDIIGLCTELYLVIHGFPVSRCFIISSGRSIFLDVF